MSWIGLNCKRRYVLVIRTWRWLLLEWTHYY